jgi:hypothetical protein
MYNGEFFASGIIDTITHPDSAALFCLRYPSKKAQSIKDRVVEASRKAMEAVGWDNGAFNIEFLHDSKTDKLMLLEINPRISQSHSSSFHLVDGLPNQSVIVDLVLGKKPEPLINNGKWDISGKFTMRTFEDAVVTNSLNKNQEKDVTTKYPSLTIKNVAPKGARLSEIPNQDNHSFLIAEAFVGADSDKDLFEKFERIKKDIHIELDN